MKKFICLFIALLTLSCAGAEEAVLPTEPAEPAESRETDLLDIFLADGESRTWITSAAQVADGAVLTSPALLESGTEDLRISDGQDEWKAEAVIMDGSGTMALIFFDEVKLPARKAPWRLMTYGDSVPADTCRVLSGDPLGGRSETAVLSAQQVTWRGCRGMLLELEDETRPGDAVINDRGELVGMVAAEYAEGTGRVMALPVEEIVRAMSEAGNMLGGLHAWGNPPAGFRVTTEKNRATFDWSGMTLPEKAEGETLYFVVADTDNDYLNYYPAETESRRREMLLMPGRTYISGILASAESPSELPEDYELTVISPAQKLTEYGFHPTLTAIAEMDENAEEGQAPRPVTEVTEELLRSERAYFYSASAYEVSERVDGKSLLITLTDPNGNCYLYESSWIYDPTYMNDDVWYLPLSATGLTYGLERSGYPQGTYRIAYYVEGELADEVTFEIK